MATRRFGSNRYLAWLKFEKKLDGASLVLCPLSVLSTWTNELKKWCPGLSVLRLHAGEPGERDRLRKKVVETVGSYDVVVTTYEVANAEARALESQLKAVIRPMYSSPPVHGARVVAEVLGDADLRAKWTAECKAMADRISEMRAALKAKLADAGSTRDWAHITDQIGMFAYTGLTADQVQAMRDEFHVYCTLDGRISVAGLTPSNVDHVAKAIHAVSK